MYTRPVEPDDRVDRRSSSPTRELVARREPRRVQGRATTSARPPSCSTTRTRSRRRSSPPGRYRNITGNVALSYGLVAAGQLSEAAGPLRVVPDHARVRHPPRAVEAQELRRAHAAGRGRDRRDRRRDRRRVRRAARRHRARAVPASTSSPRRIGPRDQPRAAAAPRRRAARRPVDRPARPRPSRPTSCSRCTGVTARRRCRSSPRSSPSHCFDAAIEAVRLALKYRTPVILLTDGYLANGAEPWLLPDVDDAARHLGAVRRREPEPRGDGLLAVPARPRDARPPVGDPGHARA